MTEKQTDLFHFHHFYSAVNPSAHPDLVFIIIILSPFINKWSPQSALKGRMKTNTKKNEINGEKRSKLSKQNESTNTHTKKNIIKEHLQNGYFDF